MKHTLHVQEVVFSCGRGQRCVKCWIVINCFFRQYITFHSSFMIELLPLHTRWDYWQLIVVLKQLVEPLPLISHSNSLFSSVLSSLVFDLCSHLAFSLSLYPAPSQAPKKRLSFNRISMATDFQSYLPNHVTLTVHPWGAEYDLV